MCIISVEPKGLRNSREDLERMELCNDDGMGFAFSTGKRVIIKKFRSFEKFYPEYSQCKNLYGKTSSFMVHFRIKTHGTNKGVFNVHPFRVSADLVFSHNGTIQNVGDSDRESDTRLFNKKILKQLKPDFLKDETQRKLIESFIGYSKLAFIDKAGRYEILNEGKGLWSGGMWYSNESFKPKPKPINYGWGGDAYNGYNSYKPYAPTGSPNNSAVKSVRVMGNGKACTWCDSESKVELVGVEWLKGETIEYEYMCGDCVSTSRYSAHSIRTVLNVK